MGFPPAGQSTVSLINDRLVLGNIGASGDDGVDVLLDSASLWTADVGMIGYDDGKLKIGAVVNEADAGAIQLVSGQSGMALWPVFNSTSYMIEYLLDGQLQLALTLPSSGQTPAAILHWDPNWCLRNGSPNPCYLTLKASVEGAWRRFFRRILIMVRWLHH